MKIIKCDVCNEEITRSGLMRGEDSNSLTFHSGNSDLNIALEDVCGECAHKIEVALSPIGIIPKKRCKKPIVPKEAIEEEVKKEAPAPAPAPAPEKDSKIENKKFFDFKTGAMVLMSDDGVPSIDDMKVGPHLLALGDSVEGKFSGSMVAIWEGTITKEEIIDMGNRLKNCDIFVTSVKPKRFTSKMNPKFIIEIGGIWGE